jgi:hypothetical protein
MTAGVGVRVVCVRVQVSVLGRTHIAQQSTHKHVAPLDGVRALRLEAEPTQQSGHTHLRARTSAQLCVCGGQVCVLGVGGGAHEAALLVRTHLVADGAPEGGLGLGSLVDGLQRLRGQLLVGVGLPQLVLDCVVCLVTYFLQIITCTEF